MGSSISSSSRVGDDPSLLDESTIVPTATTRRTTASTETSTIASSPHQPSPRRIINNSEDKHSHATMTVAAVATPWYACCPAFSSGRRRQNSDDSDNDSNATMIQVMPQPHRLSRSHSVLAPASERGKGISLFQRSHRSGSQSRMTSAAAATAAKMDNSAILHRMSISEVMQHASARQLTNDNSGQSTPGAHTSSATAQQRALAPSKRRAIAVGAASPRNRIVKARTPSADFTLGAHKAVHLASSLLAAGCTDSELAFLSSLAELHHYERGQLIMTQGAHQPNNMDLFVLCSGEICVEIEAQRFLNAASLFETAAAATTAATETTMTNTVPVPASTGKSLWSARASPYSGMSRTNSSGAIAEQTDTVPFVSAAAAAATAALAAAPPSSSSNRDRSCSLPAPPSTTLLTTTAAAVPMIPRPALRDWQSDNGHLSLCPAVTSSPSRSHRELEIVPKPLTSFNADQVLTNLLAMSQPKPNLPVATRSLDRSPHTRKRTLSVNLDSNQTALLRSRPTSPVGSSAALPVGPPVFIAARSKSPTHSQLRLPAPALATALAASPKISPTASPGTMTPASGSPVHAFHRLALQHAGYTFGLESMWKMPPPPTFINNTATGPIGSYFLPSPAASAFNSTTPSARSSFSTLPAHASAFTPAMSSLPSEIGVQPPLQENESSLPSFPRLANVVALTDCTCLHIKQQSMQQSVSEKHTLRVNNRTAREK